MIPTRKFAESAMVKAVRLRVAVRGPAFSRRGRWAVRRQPCWVFQDVLLNA